MGCASSLSFISAIENEFLNKKNQNFKKKKEEISENVYVKNSINGTVKSDNEKKLTTEKITYNNISETKSIELQNIPLKDPNEKIIDDTLDELASTKEETFIKSKDVLKNDDETAKMNLFEKIHTKTDFTEMQSNYSFKTNSTDPEIEQSFVNNIQSISVTPKQTGFSNFQKISSTGIVTKNLLSTTAADESINNSKNTKKTNFPIYRPRSNRTSSKPTKWEQQHDNLSRSGKKLHRRKSSVSIFSDDSTMFKKPHTLYLVFGNNFLKTPKIKIIESQKGSRWMIKPKQTISELNVYTGVKTVIGEEEISTLTVKKPTSIVKKQTATIKKQAPSDSTKPRWNSSGQAVEKPLEKSYLPNATDVEREISPTFGTVISTNNLNLSSNQQQQDIIQKRWDVLAETVNTNDNDSEFTNENLTQNTTETASGILVSKRANSILNNVRQQSNLSQANTISTRESKVQTSATNIKKKSAIPVIKPNIITLRKNNRLEPKINSVRQISNLSQANTISTRASRIRSSSTNIKKNFAVQGLKQNTIITVKNNDLSQQITSTNSKSKIFKKVETDSKNLEKLSSTFASKISPRPIFNIKAKQNSELNIVNQTIIEPEKNVTIEPEVTLIEPSKGLTIADIVSQTMKRKDSNETNSDSVRKEKAKLWLKSLQTIERINDNPPRHG